MPRKTREILQAWERGAASDPAARRGEADYSVFFENISQNIWRLDRANRVLFANAGAAAALGLTPETVVGAAAEPLLRRLDPQWRKHVEQAFRTRTPCYGVEAQFLLRGRAPQWTSTDFVPDPTGGENGDGSLIVVSSDITALKERESELEVALAEVDHNRRLFERLYRRTPVLLCTFQRDGRMIETSDLWREKTGYARDDLIGRRLGDFLDPDSRRRWEDDALPGLWRDGSCETVPLAFVAKAGGTMEVELSGYLAAEDGGASLCLAVLIDVTARSAAERALARANSELAAANEGLKRFAQVASHDLKEPLRKIKQIGDLLRAEPQAGLSEDALFYIGVMSESAERMRRLIRDILAFSRSVNAPLSRARVPLAEVARETLAEFELAIRETGAQVRVGSLPTVLGDRTAAQLLMRNLIGNSLKHRRPDVAPDIAVEGGWGEDGDYALRFRDNGRGVDPRFHESVFEPFTRLQSRDEADGSGLGLAICKSVCERQRWRIALKSAPGEGAEFIVTLPAADVLLEPRGGRSSRIPA